MCNSPTSTIVSRGWWDLHGFSVEIWYIRISWPVEVRSPVLPPGPIRRMYWPHWEFHPTNLCVIGITQATQFWKFTGRGNCWANKNDLQKLGWEKRCPTFSNRCGWNRYYTGKIEDDPLRTRMELRFKQLFPLSLYVCIYICIGLYHNLGCITISSDWSAILVNQNH